MSSLIEMQNKQAAYTQKKCRKRQVNRLRACNIIAGALHAVSFIAALITTFVLLDDSVRTELTTDFRRYDAGAMGPPQAGPFSSSLESLGFYQIIWIIVPFPLITAAFHFLIAFVPKINAAYNKNVFLYGHNPLRWLEYSITASMMTWVIAALSAIANVFLLALIGVVLNVVLQYQGYLMEKLNPLSVRDKCKRIDWTPLIMGWLIFVGQWVPIYWYFFVAVTSDRPESAPDVPWFVYSIVIGLSIQFAMFGIVHVMHFCRVGRRFRSAYAMELGFVTLSLTSKFFLTWNLLIGIATNRPANQ